MLKITAKINLRKKNYEYNHIRKEIEILESIPKGDVSTDIKDIILELKSKENKFVKEKIEGSMLRAKVPHIEPNEADIAYYARLEKISGEKNNIYCLCDDNGILKEGTENVIKIVHDFYSTLYRKEAECRVSQDEFLDKVTMV